MIKLLSNIKMLEIQFNIEDEKHRSRLLFTSEKINEMVEYILNIEKKPFVVYDVCNYKIDDLIGTIFFVISDEFFEIYFSPPKGSNLLLERIPFPDIKNIEFIMTCVFEDSMLFIKNHLSFIKKGYKFFNDYMQKVKYE